jgi:two-component system, cell cycle sensor histidine kinase and response regulator CckA
VTIAEGTDRNGGSANEQGGCGLTEAPLRVLLVEDSATDAKLVTRELERAGRAIEIERVETASALRAALARQSWDVVISDWSLPSFGARAALEILKELGLDHPFIIISGTVGEEHAVAAMRAGAHDYVLKGDLSRLGPAIERELRERQARDEHRRGEGARREAELRFQRLSDAGIIGITVVSTSGTVIEANDTFLAMVGYTREDLRAGILNWIELTPPDRRGENAAVGRELISRGCTRPFEKEYLRKDGTRVPVLVGLALLDEGRVITVVTDLTGRKLAEERKSAVVDAAVEAIIGMDQLGRITEFNPAAERTFGYSREDVLGRALADVIIPPRFRAAHVQGLERYLATGEGPVIGKRVELSALHSNGAEIPIELSISRLGSEKTPSFVGFLRDISEPKRLERALLERMRVAALGADVGMTLTDGATFGETLQRCCEAVVKNLDAAFARVWILNTTTRILELQASAGIYTHLDGPHGQIPLGKGEIGLLAEERRPHVTNDLQNDRRLGDRDWARREGLQSFAGHPLLVDGTVIGVLAMFAREALSDVTLAGLASVADAMAVRIRGKLAEQEKGALEEQLRQAQKMEAVGRLAGGIAHDFNNVLSVVLSYADLLMGDLEKGNPIRADIEEIRRAGERAAALTRQLLMFSRQQVIQPRVLDLNELLAGMDKLLRRIVGEDVTLTCILDVQPGCVRVDPGSIEQVVMNLAVNARDAMPTGGKLTLETMNVILDEEYTRSHLGAKPGPYVMLSVTDTGSGIDKKTLARIFDPFFTTKEPGKGTGLGLATVFGIMQQSGGNVWVYSELGIGTTFKVYLPRVDAAAQQQLQVSTSSTLLRGSETILLVEDEQQVRDVARGILRRHGYTVLDAEDAGAALALCEQHVGPIHLLVSDVVMPGLSGPALAKRLAVLRPDMRVLCMSGYTDDAAVRHGVIDAAFAYLQKPITVEALTRKVRDVLDAERRAE